MTMNFWCTTLSFLLCLAAPLHCCRGSQEPTTTESPVSIAVEYETKLNEKPPEDPSFFNKSWFSRPPHKDTFESWELWGDNFRDRYDNALQANKAKLKVPTPNWWEDKGNGFTGMDDDIPPWALEPINGGRPSECFELHVQHTCPPRRPLHEGESGARYYYDPYENECKQFHFSGCGGTMNHFRTVDACRTRCVDYRPVGCSSDSGVKLQKSRLYHDDMYPE